MYKIIARVIVNRIKGILASLITGEQFAFLAKRQIHNPIAIAKEFLHSAKIKKIPAAIINVDLSKAYDHVNWTLLRHPIANLF